MTATFAAAQVGDNADADAQARSFVQTYEAEVRPLEIEVGLRWWAANISGKDEDYQVKQEAETCLELKLADRQRFAALKAIRQAGPTDRRLARQIELLYLQAMGRQVDPELIKRILAKSNALERAFNVYRARVDGEDLTDNQVRQVLTQSKDSRKRQTVWEASKGVGPVVVGMLRELVELRNQVARSLGYADYHVMQLALGEQSQAEVLALFEQLDDLTRRPFQQVKATIDAALAQQYGIAVEHLRPWHYHDPFFQEVPDVFGPPQEGVYTSIEILDACRKFYAGIGLPVDDVLDRSDLYEKPGKNPHAFCTDIDRAGDVRVLANIVPGHRWLSTMLHELGHAVYSSKNIPESMPYVLRTESHTLTTEGIAMLFERLADRSAWLVAMGALVPHPKAFDQAADQRRRAQALIFSRWCQVMFRFERELYGRPDRDMNRLWWDLVEQYQGLRRPEGRDLPDYASKIHLVIAPAYYHNYMLGELFATQLQRTIASQVLGGGDPRRASYVGQPAVGQFLRERVFAPGRSLNWNELTRHATGEALNAAAFAEGVQQRY